jgi:hypothetical protein
MPAFSAASLPLGAALAAAAILVAGLAAARAETPGLRFAPPRLDYAALCRKVEAAAPGEAWSRFDGRLVGSPKEALAAARWYAAGGEGRAPDAATARRILEALLALGDAAPVDARADLARLDLAEATDDAARGAAIAALEAAMLRGSVAAAVVMGRLHERGEGVPRDPLSARRAYQIAAAAGEVDAQLGLARLARSGALPDVGAEDADRMARTALTSLIGAIGAGECDALATIGFAYRSGDVAPRDEALAIAWLEAAAGVGHPAAAEAVAIAYRNGEGVPVDHPRAMRFYAIAAAAGRPRALYDLGAALARGDGAPRDREAGRAYLERAAAAGRVDALRILASAYRGEFGDAPEPDRALRYLEAIAGRSDADGEMLVALGRALLEGAGTAVDPLRAAALFERAALRGSAQAAVLLGDLLSDPARPGHDVRRAARAYRLAAELGNPAALAALARLHACGRGVPFSADRAWAYTERAAHAGQRGMLRRWLLRTMSPGDPRAKVAIHGLIRAAAIAGEREAQAEMTLIHETGHGVPGDPAAAARWRALALAPGPDLAVGHLALGRLRMADAYAAADLPRAREHIDKALALGDAGAHMLLGRYHARVKSPLSDAVGAYRAAWDAGEPDAAAAIFDLSDADPSAHPDFDLWRERAEAAGHLPAALHRIAAIADPGRRVEELDRVAARGPCQPREQIALGQAYLETGTQQGAAAARTIFERLVAMRYPEPEIVTALASALMQGALGEAGKTEANRMLEWAAARGHVPAMLSLARAARSLADVPARHAVERRWLRAALDAGSLEPVERLARLILVDGREAGGEAEALQATLAARAVREPHAARLLGKLSLEGLFGSAETASAAAHLERAAGMGDVEAMRLLGQGHLYGLFGRADRQTGLGWLDRAVAHGDARAARDAAAARAGAPVATP